VNDPYDITLNPYQLSQVKGYKFVL